MNKKKMYSTPVIVLAIIGAIITMIINCVSIGSFMKDTMRGIVGFSSDSVYDDFTDGYDDYSDDFGDGYTDDYSEEDLEGVDPSTEALSEIEAYEADGVTVTYETKKYSLGKNVSDGGVIYFNIQYPALSGVEGADLEAINAALEDQAMVSADKYYLDPQGKANLEPGASGTYVVSEVTYNVVYLTDDFISVVYEDRYCKGDESAQYIDMRACNIDLKTGTTYDLSQIVKGSDELSEDFQEALDDKYQTNEVIYGIPVEDYTEMLSGEETVDGSYMGFYRTEDGIEMFVTFHYYTEDGYGSVGWFTAPFTMDDMEDYKNDSDYWKIAQ